MDIRQTRKFLVGRRSLVVLVFLVVLLCVSLIANLRQQQVIEQIRRQKIAAERAKAEQAAVDAARVEARRVSKAEEAAANERMRQLYGELDHLSQISERLLAQPAQKPIQPGPETSLGAIDDLP